MDPRALLPEQVACSYQKYKNEFEYELTDNIDGVETNNDPERAERGLESFHYNIDEMVRNIRLVQLMLA